MKVGDYIRTETYIGKILNMIPNKGSKTFTLKVSIGHGLYITIRDCHVLITSSRIFKLIDEDDYVNGLKVIAIDVDKKLIVLDDFSVVYEDCIYSVVTKEQFESMEYKVGE